MQLQSIIPEGIIEVAATDPTAFTIFGGSILLTGLVGCPVVLGAISSSVFVDPLTDWTPICEETDKGLERPDGGVFVG